MNETKRGTMLSSVSGYPGTTPQIAQVTPLPAHEADIDIKNANLVRAGYLGT
jgi:hypothetical protein